MADLLARGMNYCKEFIDEYEKLCGRTMTADDLGRVRPYIVCFRVMLISRLVLKHFKPFENVT